MQGIILETEAQYKTAQSLYTHGTNTLVGETDDKYAKHILVFLRAILLSEHSFPCPTPTPNSTPIPQGQMGHRTGSITAVRVQLTAWKSQSLLNQNAGIIFKSPLSLTLAPHIQPACPSFSVHLSLTKLMSSPSLTWVPAMAFQPLVLPLQIQLWLEWLSGLSTGLQTKGSLVGFPVRAHTWVVGQIPNRGHMRGNHTVMFLSLSSPPPQK